MKHKSLLLTPEEEDLLESNIIWVIGTIRSGTTWLARRLLSHKDSITWNEPFIGLHLNANTILRSGVGHAVRKDYFFSKQFEQIWMPALRKLILARTYAQVETLTKKIIIKEPNASGVAQILLNCLPKSKMIFILRDGRDVIDSMIDAHREGSWNPGAKPLKTKERRLEEIKIQSEIWKVLSEKNFEAFNKQDSKLRLLVKYEDLRKDTLKELKRIYHFIGIKIGDNLLQKKIEKFDFKNIPDKDKGPGKFNRSANPGSWKENLSKEEQELMNSILSDTLKKFEYSN